jgi:hypothetical protein
MASAHQSILTLCLFMILVPARVGLAQKFFPDDPIQEVPPPLPVVHVLHRDINQVYDFLHNSRRPEPRPPVPAGAVNTLGEVPDSEWFTNRHERRRMTREELQRGAGTSNAPQPPFIVIGGKRDGVSLGFRMQDSLGRLYFVKSDPLTNPEMATAAEIIVSKFFYALGYNTPEYYIVYAKRSDFQVSPKAQMKSRKMTWADFEDIVRNIPHSPDGSFRILASLVLEGESIGPFRYEGTRKDDPNDIVPHENRRDLRGLFVLSAWLNHTDSKSGNSLDTIIQKNGYRFIRHHLIDFASSLGSDGIFPKDPQLGHEFMIPRLEEVLPRIVNLGLIPAEWEQAKFPKLSEVGNFESETFKPDQWKSNYPNPAFLSRLPDDEFWGAKLVMAFRDDDIRAIVETGQYSDPRAVDYVTRMLARRRDEIGRTYFSKLLPLDYFRVQNGELLFEDLAFKYGLGPAQQYTFGWFQLNNATQQRTPLLDGKENLLPLQVLKASAGSYFSARIQLYDDPQKSVIVDIRRTAAGFDVVGIERSW